MNVTELGNNKTIIEPKRHHSEEAIIQNRAPPTHNLNYPPPLNPTQNSETAAILDCICQLQLSLQQHIITNSKETDYHMSQNTDLFTEMIQGQNGRNLHRKGT